MKGDMPYELLVRVLSESEDSTMGTYKQHCFDSPLWFNLHIAVTVESSIVLEEQAASVIWVGVARIYWKMERAGTDVVRVA